MFKKQSFESNIYMKLLRYVYIAFTSSLCFTLVNLPLFFAVIILAIDVRNIPVFALTLLFVGPGVTSLFYVLDNLFREKDVEPVITFFQGYKKFWVKGLLYGLIAWLSIIVLFSDIYIFAKLPWGKWLIPFFLVLSGLALSLSINCWYFQIRNPLSGIKDVLRLAFYWSLKKWYVSVLNIVLFTSIFILMVLKPQFGFVIVPSILLGIIYLNMSFERLKKIAAKDK